MSGTRTPPPKPRDEPPLIALRGATIRLAERLLVEEADIAVARGERIALVGRNGSGKTTLLKALAGWIEPDRGERFVQPGARIAYLPQDPLLPAEQSVRDHVIEGLPAGARPHEAEAAISGLGLDGDALLGTLSGGGRRRAALARALAGRPDVLLLDEPTNHLDLPSIEWLEATLQAHPAGILTISHDRAFLEHLSRRLYWLDRGRLHRLNDGFAGFEDWSEKLLADEAAQAHRLARRIESETKWLREGISARRKRNQGRVRALADLRRERREWRRQVGNVDLSAQAAEAPGTLALEAVALTKAAPDGRLLVDRFSNRILKGDRVGIIGPNGAGKSTLLKLLIGRESPDSGRVRQGFGLEIAYFDQTRESLSPEATPWSTLCPDGGDSVFIAGRPRHVVSYLKDFLFDDRQATQKIASLSGGERNRLLLARLFSQPHNLLVLDEPTNDLDLETLDLLEEAVASYAGTVILVSHDRDFLDRTVTSILAFEGGGRITEYAGGYTDYLAQRPPPPGEAPRDRPAARSAPAPQPARQATRLSYKEQRELDLLPARIAALEGEIAGLEARLADPDLYRRDPAGFAAATARLNAARAELSAAEDSWLALEERREALAG
ncbi:MAG: ATP-binding cassette domain-containing protein [Thalassobaculales bacterium]